MCMCLYVYATGTQEHTGAKSVSDPLDLELQGVVSSQARMLETKLQSSEEQHAQFTAESSLQTAIPLSHTQKLLV